MKTLKKYVYVSPETEILSLGAKHILMESGEWVPPTDSQNPDMGAPWRY